MHTILNMVSYECIHIAMHLIPGLFPVADEPTMTTAGPSAAIQGAIYWANPQWRLQDPMALPCGKDSHNYGKSPFFL